ncbi:MAG: phage Gp37/Gp68 family protein [Muribaculaceae bacterium]|nr:phage Gp37/Gp68 family protein [Muribaculaceae bacterium]
MHDIWNPWHGCVKASEGCDHCYMYYLDRMRGADGRRVYRTGNFDYPLQRRRGGGYRVRSGEQIRVCMTSDFFLDEADRWRPDAWSIIRQRSDVRFYLLTKRPERVARCLPADWGDGWENVFFNVTCENQRRADQRMPLLLDLPFRHKGVMAAPLIGPVDIDRYLADGQIEQVVTGGENYDGARPCDFDWVKSLSNQCKRHDVTFCFIETGTQFIKDGRTYTLPSKRLQAEMAFKAGVNHTGRPTVYDLRDPLGFEIPPESLHHPTFRPGCATCGSRPICNGCSNCGKCTD